MCTSPNPAAAPGRKGPWHPPGCAATPTPGETAQSWWQGLERGGLRLGDHLRLLHGPGTCDQNIHESPGALLPLRAGGDTGDANESSQQVDRIEVLADVAVFD